jgi:hypothetical protein
MDNWDDIYRYNYISKLLNDPPSASGFAYSYNPTMFNSYNSIIFKFNGLNTRQMRHLVVTMNSNRNQYYHGLLMLSYTINVIIGEEFFAFTNVEFESLLDIVEMLNNLLDNKDTDAYIDEFQKRRSDLSFYQRSIYNLINTLSNLWRNKEQLSFNIINYIENSNESIQHYIDADINGDDDDNSTNVLTYSDVAGITNNSEDDSVREIYTRMNARIGDENEREIVRRRNEVEEQIEQQSDDERQIEEEEIDRQLHREHDLSNLLAKFYEDDYNRRVIGDDESTTSRRRLRSNDNNDVEADDLKNEHINQLINNNKSKSGSGFKKQNNFALKSRDLFKRIKDSKIRFTYGNPNIHFFKQVHKK